MNAVEREYSAALARLREQLDATPVGCAVQLSHGTATAIVAGARPAGDDTAPDGLIIDGDLLRDLIADATGHVVPQLSVQACRDIAERAMNDAGHAGMTVLHGPGLVPRAAAGPRAGDTAPVVEHVTAVVPTEHPNGSVSLARVDGTIIGPRSIARPEALVTGRPPGRRLAWSLYLEGNGTGSIVTDLDTEEFAAGSAATEEEARSIARRRLDESPSGGKGQADADLVAACRAAVLRPGDVPTYLVSAVLEELDKSRAASGSMAVISAAGRVVSLWNDWPRDRRDRVSALSKHLFDALVELTRLVRLNSVRDGGDRG